MARTVQLNCHVVSAMLMLLAMVCGGTGCRQMVHFQPRHLPPTGAPAPRELHKAILPEYRIEPPDVLVVDNVHVVPGPAYRLRTLDTISIGVEGTLPEDPINGIFPIEPGGMVHLGGGYGRVKVTGMTANDAQEAIRTHLTQFLKEPLVNVSLATTGTTEQIAGQHLVAPDGMVTLGSYGSVPVVGLTKAEAKGAIEAHLAEFLEDPEVAVDVFGYNSKVYYVVTQGAGLGDNVFSFPSTGNETILDAVALINGLTEVSSKRIWIARPGRGSDQVFPVDWPAITQCGDATTNYQVLPGDRIYVAEDRMVAFDNHLAKIIAPFERLMGFTLLGTQTATRLSGKVLRGGGDPRGATGTFF